MQTEWLINVEQNLVLKGFTKTATKAEIIDRKKQAIEREKQQEKLFEAEKVFKQTVHAKLIEAGAKDYCEAHNEKWFQNFARCDEEEYFQLCQDCMKIRKLKYRCCLKWCPCCNWRASNKRKELLERMTIGIYSVYHLVLTQNNFEENLLSEIRASRKNLFKLRKRKFMGKISGGCSSLEFTKEKKGSWKNGVKLAGGWHLHWHILLQTNFLPMKEISKAWAVYVGQKFAICKYKEVDEESYLKEIFKYVVKGAEIARWSPAEILEFVLAIEGTRCFGCFGKFTEMQKHTRALMACEEPEKPSCECGGESFSYGKSEGDARLAHLHTGNY